MSDKILEVPVHIGVTPIISKAQEGNSLIAYGHYGWSPLNGGRYFFSDKVYDPSVYLDQHENIKWQFRNEVLALNRAGVPFFLTYTNLFCSQEELESSPTTRVFSLLENFFDENGVIVANPYVERYVREHHSKLKVGSSCQRLSATEEVLDDMGRVDFYTKALEEGDYAFVVLTPTDSQKPEIIEKIPAHLREGLVAILNSECGEGCNPYWHYREASLGNKVHSYLSDNRAHILDFEEAKRRRGEYVVCQPRSVLQSDIIDALDDLGVGSFKVGRSCPGEDLETMEWFLDREAA